MIHFENARIRTVLVVELWSANVRLSWAGSDALRVGDGMPDTWTIFVQPNLVRQPLLACKSSTRQAGVLRG